MRDDQSMPRINVVGAGQWGPNLIRNFHTSPRCRVGIVCDLDRDRLAAISARFPGLRTTTESQEAILDPEADAVAVITPVSTHYPLVRQALEAGRDVLVEKPLAATSDQCRELHDLALRQQRVLMVGHVFKFNPGIRYVARLVGEGAIGRVISLHAIRTNLGPVRSDVNALWDLGSHDLSIFNYWLGVSPLSVTASGLRHLSREREDTVIANYLYPDQVMATVYTSWLHPRKVREITVVGEEKMVVWNDMDLYEPVRIYDKGVETSGDRYSDTFGAFRLTLREGPVVIPPVRGSEPLAAECDHFLDCIQSRERPLTDSLDGWNVVRALEAADASLADGSRSVQL